MDRLEEVIKNNFEPEETNLPVLVSNTNLYIVDVNRNVHYVKDIKRFPRTVEIVGLCFMSNDHIYCFCIHEKYHSKGYGTCLLSYLIKYIKKSSLMVRKSNENAIKLYTRCGFIPIKEHEDFYSYTSTNENSIEMTYN